MFHPAAAEVAPPAGPALVRLNLGCGRSPLPGWINVDCVPLPGVDLVHDLDACAELLFPYQDNSVDEIFMSHTIEHLRNTLPLMQELHRVAKPDALCTIRCPYGSSDDAWEDPTHVRPYFIRSFGFFSQPYFWRADYNFRGDWQPETLDLIIDGSQPAGLTVDQLLPKLLGERNVITEMVAVLRCVKPIREPRKELQVLPKITFRYQGEAQEGGPA
jgi:SAM-dependent methyltransferase